MKQKLIVRSLAAAGLVTVLGVGGVQYYGPQEAQARTAEAAQPENSGERKAPERTGAGIYSPPRSAVISTRFRMIGKLAPGAKRLTELSMPVNSVTRLTSTM